MSQSAPTMLEALLACVPTGALAFRRDGPGGPLMLVYANRASAELFVQDLAAAQGEPLEALFPRAHTLLDACLATLADGLVREVRLASGKWPRVVEQPCRVHRLDERTVGVVLEAPSAVHHAEVRRAYYQLDSILEQVPAMIFVKDARDLRFQRCNREFEELLGVGRAQLLGKNDFDLVPREQAEFFVASDRAVLTSRQLLDVPAEPIQTPRGERWLHTRKIPLLDEAGEPYALLGIALDITDRRHAEEVLRDAHDELARQVDERTRALFDQVEATERAQTALKLTEDQLRQAQKMEAVGRLAGGVAHDFNNMLSVVFGYCDLALGRVSPDEPLGRMVVEIQKAGRRAADLTGRLLAFSRQQVLRPRTLDLSQVIGAMQGMLERLVGEDIALRVVLVDTEHRVRADPSQIEQALMNLVVNARDAMPAGGKLTIETSLVHLDEHYVAEHLGARPGPHLVLSVSDTGAGMDAATRSRIFEPFFTTKETGKGTGLGLSTVHGIVQQSEGSIWVYSEPGRGTTFKVYLPVVHPTGSEPEVARVEKSLVPRAGGETILLVEDDEQLRILTAQVLRHHGYRVLEAPSGRPGAEVFREHGGEIQLLLTDVVMPELGGRALAEELTRQSAGLRVIYMSGYTDDAVVHHGVLEKDVNYLQKPFTPSALIAAVRAVLDA